MRGPYGGERSPNAIENGDYWTTTEPRVVEEPEPEEPEG